VDLDDWSHLIVNRCAFGGGLGAHRAPGADAPFNISPLRAPTRRHPVHGSVHPPQAVAEAKHEATSAAVNMFAQQDALDQQSHVAPAPEPPVRVHSSSTRVEAVDSVALAVRRQDGVQGGGRVYGGVEAGRAAQDSSSLAWEMAERDMWGTQPGQRCAIRPDSVAGVEAGQRRNPTQPIPNETMQTQGVSVQWPEGRHTASAR
jgi:hypothetical protein